MNRAVAALSRLLERNDRECVCGDIEELGLSAPRAAVSILGLALRRQMAEWAHWGPWVAVIGVAGLSGYNLSESVSRVHGFLLIQLRTYLKYGVAYQSGGMSPEEQITWTATAAVALVLWFWACGFVLASLSKRALPITFLMFYSVVRSGWLIRSVLGGNIVLKNTLVLTVLWRYLPADPAIIVLLIAFGLGVRSARLGMRNENARRFVIVAAFAFVVLLFWMQSWFAIGFAHWSETAYVPAPFFRRIFPFLAVSWPAFSIPFLRSGMDKHRQQPHAA